MKLLTSSLAALLTTQLAYTCVTDIQDREERARQYAAEARATAEDCVRKQVFYDGSRHPDIQDMRFREVAHSDDNNGLIERILSIPTGNLPFKVVNALFEGALEKKSIMNLTSIMCYALIRMRSDFLRRQEKKNDLQYRMLRSLASDDLFHPLVATLIAHGVPIDFYGKLELSDPIMESLRCHAPRNLQALLEYGKANDPTYFEKLVTKQYVRVTK